MRIPANRIGYIGWICTGIPTYTIDPQACAEGALDSSSEPFSLNNWKKLPMEMASARVNISFYPLTDLLVDLSTPGQRIYDLARECDISFDPFTGAFINLYQEFIDTGYEDRISDDCYEPGESYPNGYMNPKSLARLFQPPLPLPVFGAKKTSVVKDIECDESGMVTITKEEVLK